MDKRGYISSTEEKVLFGSGATKNGSLTTAGGL
jgi:hypothetical protein